MCRGKHGTTHVGRGSVGFIGGESGIGFPHADMNDHVWIESCDDIGNFFSAVQGNPAKVGAHEPATWRICVDSQDVAGPGFLFDHRRDERAQFTATAGDEDALSRGVGHRSS